MKKKLLISGLGGSLFPDLHNYLKDKYEIFYVDADERLKYLYNNYNFYAAPLVTTDKYWYLIKEIISLNQIEYYIPLIDEEIIKAKEVIEGFNNVKVISPTCLFARLCLNKAALMEQLRDYGISVVASYPGNLFNWQLELPVFVKPIAGRGSRGIRKIDNRLQLTAYYQLENYAPEEILIQEYLSGVEYTIGVLVNNLNEVISISSKRIIRKKGITIIAITENNSLIDDVALKIVQQFQPCGPMNIQLTLTEDNQIKIFEINPRFSTTTIMEFEGGIDLISAYVDNYDKHYFGEIMRPKSGLILHRRWENIFYND